MKFAISNATKDLNIDDLTGFARGTNTYTHKNLLGAYVKRTVDHIEINDLHDLLRLINEKGIIEISPINFDKDLQSRGYVGMIEILSDTYE